MRTVIIVYGTYSEDNTAKCDIITATFSPEWADKVMELYKYDYDNVYKETHYIE